MPNSGMKKISPIRPPQSAPLAAPNPAIEGWCSLILPPARCSTITASSSSIECSFIELAERVA